MIKKKVLLMAGLSFLVDISGRDAFGHYNAHAGYGGTYRLDKCNVLTNGIVTDITVAICGACIGRHGK